MISTMRQHHRVRVGLSAFIAGGVLSVASFYAGIRWERGAGLLPEDKGDDPAKIIMATPMLDAIFQNTPGQSEGYALGVPKDYAWCSGSYKPAVNGSPPLDFTAVTGKGQVYPKEGARAYSTSRHYNCKCKNLHPPQRYPRMGVSPRPGHGRDRRGVLCRGLLAESGQADEVRGATGPQCGHWRSSGRIQRSFLAN